MKNKINIYLMGYRSRWGDSGVTTHYTEREQVESLFSWLEEDDIAEIRGMLNRNVDAGEIFNRIGEMLDSSGHEFYPQTVAIEVEKAEPPERPVLKALLEWEKFMGGFEAPAWEQAKALMKSS